jgi:hypothetical protein
MTIRPKALRFDMFVVVIIFSIICMIIVVVVIQVNLGPQVS